MSGEALNIYAKHLDFHLGEGGKFTEEAIYDATGANRTIFGIFDNTTETNNTDKAHIDQKQEYKIFATATVLTFDIYTDKKLLIVSSGETYTIQYVGKDEKGFPKMWLV